MSQAKERQQETGTKVTWGIGRKLAFAFASLVILTVFVGAVALVGLSVLNNAVDQAVNRQGRLVNLVNQIGEIFQQARQRERDYLLRYEEVGFEQAKDDYVTVVQQELVAMRGYLEEMGALSDDGTGRQQKIAQVKTQLEEYETAFLLLVEKLQERGLEGTGLAYEFSNVGQELEDAWTGSRKAGETQNFTILNLRRREQDYLLSGEDEYITQVHSLVEQLTKQLATSYTTEEQATLGALLDDYSAGIDSLVAVDGEISGAIEELGDAAEVVVSLIEEMRKDELGARETALDTVDEVSSTVTVIVGAGVVVSIVVGVGVAVLMSRNISNPIRQLTQVARAVADGDLELEAQVKSRDETGMLAAVLNRMIGRLRETLQNEQQERNYLETTVRRYVEHAVQVGGGELSARLALEGLERGEDDPLVQLGQQLNWMTSSMQRIIDQIGRVASRLSTTSAVILASTTQQVSGASEQSAAISQTTTTVDEVRTIAEQTVVRAQEVADASQRSVEFSRAGEGAVQNTIESMAGIKHRVEGIAENILALSEQTQQIGAIIATVNDIASQSNMLALNASVEAARAGEQGKGFAVVAMEVRSLAEQSKQATTQVEAILSDIQKATNMTVMATEEGTKGVEEGVTLSARTGEVIQQLGGALTQSAQAAAQMVAGGQQQTSGIEQIALAMGNINQATVQSLASTRQAEKAARDMSELARELTATVERYQ